MVNDGCIAAHGQESCEDNNTWSRCVDIQVGANSIIKAGVKINEI